MIAYRYWGVVARKTRVLDARAEALGLGEGGCASGDRDVADEALPVRVERGRCRVGRELRAHLVVAPRLAREKPRHGLTRVAPLELRSFAAEACSGARTITRYARCRLHLPHGRRRRQAFAGLNIGRAASVGEEQRAPTWRVKSDGAIMKGARVLAPEAERLGELLVLLSCVQEQGGWGGR